MSFVTMSPPIAIPNAVVAASVSPTTGASLHERMAQAASGNVRQPKVLHPVENENLRLLLLENISQEAVKRFRSEGFHVDHHTKAMSEEELLEKIPQYHAIGIRSKTKITAKVIKAATKVHSLPSSAPSSPTHIPIADRHRLLLHRHEPGRP